MTSDPAAPDPLARLFRDAPPEEGPVSPFTGDASARATPDARLRNAIVRLRHIRSQAGTDGLTPSATRSLLDELVRALEAIGESLGPGDGHAP